MALVVIDIKKNASSTFDLKKKKKTQKKKLISQFLR